MDKYYDSISDGYEELHEEEQLKKLNFIMKNLKSNDLMLSKKDFLLDIGCGSGISTRFWNFCGCRKIGIDPSVKLLEKARMKDSESEYLQAVGEKLPFKDDSFDVVVTLTALQNFYDPEKGLLEMNRVAKHLIIITFLKKSLVAKNLSKLIIQHLEVIFEFDEGKDKIFFCSPIKSNRKI